MQIELVETFLDLVETRSFHATAERLGVTQSTVSARIQSLEQALGQRLFNRSRAGTQLSFSGQRFEAHARLLRHEWNEARARIALPDREGGLIRVGIQNDLAAGHVGEWMRGWRRQMPEAAFYVQSDYSAQMCADILTGLQDFAVMYSPTPHPDLHFESVGDVAYRMVSTTTDRLEEVAPAQFIFAHFSAAFEQMHRELTPDLARAPVSVGQSATVVSLLTEMGGTGYVLDRTATGLVTTGNFRLVEDAPVIRQPVYVAMHLRHRTTPMHRLMHRIVHRRLRDERRARDEAHEA